MSGTIPREVRPLAAAARLEGWAVEVSRGGHLVFVSPTGGKVFTSRTPSDWRAVRNLRAQLRRAGLEVRA